MGQSDVWELDIQYGEDYDTYVDEWGTTVVRPKGGHYFDYRIFPIKEGTVEAFQAWKDWPDPNNDGRWEHFSSRLPGSARDRKGNNLLFGIWGRHL